MIGFMMEHIEAYLREELAAEDRGVELQWDGYPPIDAPPLFIGIYDNGESNISSQTDMLQKIVTNVCVCVWSRSRPMPPGMLYNDLRYDDKYRMPYKNVDELCMLVKKHLAGTGRWDLWTRIKDAVKADCESFEEVPTMPLFYISASGPEMYTPPQSTEGHFETMQPGWVGRRLMFAGLTRLVSLKV